MITLLRRLQRPYTIKLIRLYRDGGSTSVELSGADGTTLTLMFDYALDSKTRGRLYVLSSEGRQLVPLKSPEEALALVMLKECLDDRFSPTEQESVQHATPPFDEPQYDDWRRLLIAIRHLETLSDQEIEPSAEVSGAAWYPPADRPVSRPTPTPVGTPTLLFRIFLAVGVLLLALTAVLAVNNLRGRAGTLTVPGQVVSVVTRRSSNGTLYYYPVVEFITADGELQVLESSIGSWPASYEIGDIVTVLYNPDAPAASRIKSTEGTVMEWFPAVILGILGAGFAGFALLVRRFL
ncbi:MAG: DUF3592 domain-containing protein [Anaerolineae bacterium]